jgi:hypothetical protein
MRKLITVTEHHTNNGLVNSRICCPIALAILEKVPGCHPYVGREHVGFEGRFKNQKPLPRSARRFIKKFDRYGKNAVKPFRFYVEVPNAS